MAADHTQNLRLCLRLFRFMNRQGEIAHAGFQHLAVLIDNRQLAARAEAGIDAQRHLAANRRLHEQLMQVIAKDADRALVGFIRQLIADFALQRRLDQPRPRVIRRCADNLTACAARLDDLPADDLTGAFVVAFHADLQPFLALAAVDGKDAVTRRTQNRLTVIGVLRIDVFAFLGGDAAEHARPPVKLAKLGADGRIVAELLRQNILRKLHGSLRIRHALFIADICLRQCKRFIPAPLGENGVCQRLDALLPRNHRTRAAFGLIRAVDILQLGKRDRGGKLFFNLLVEFSLLGNARHNLLAAFIQPAQIIQPLADFAELLVVHRAGHLLAVSGNEGNGVSLVDERNDAGNNRGIGRKFVGQ